MKNVDTEAGIVLGVAPDGHLSDGTVAFAVRTAQQLGVGIEVVLVVPSLIGTATGTWDVGITVDQMTHEGRVALDRAVAQVRQRMGDVQPVCGALLHGGVVATLVECSTQAQLVVLEHRQHSTWDRLTLGSVTAGVAARAHAPVVSVPASWQPTTATRPIVVGVEDAARAGSELWTALGLAAAADVPVLALRVAYLAPAYEEILMHTDRHEDLVRAAREELARAADLPASVCERVPCTFAVRWGRPAEVLVEASDAAYLLVLARRDPRLPFGSHLGSVVREVLRRAVCPVMVVEPSLPGPVVEARSPQPVSASAG
jgi:nucleotide-binding universal stress UspA family protein